MLSTFSSAFAQVDMHCHAVTDAYRSFITDHGAALDEGFPLPQWSAEAQVAFMDAAGIEVAMLTMPAPHPYFGNAAEAAAACHKYNDACADLSVRYPGRSRFCAALPLPDVEAAIREAVYALDTLHADKEAYEHHLQMPHFKNYKERTANMVKSLRLTDTSPVAGRLKY